MTAWAAYGAVVAVIALALLASYTDLLPHWFVHQSKRGDCSGSGATGYSDKRYGC